MPVDDLLVDSAAGNEIVSLMDGYSGYNQIFIAEEDVPKTAFRCPGSIGTFEWVVMPFGLKNAGSPKRARERRRQEEVKEFKPESSPEHEKLFLQRMMEIQTAMEESYSDDQKKLAFEFGKAYQQVYQDLEKELEGTDGQDVLDLPAKPDGRDQTLNTSDFDVSDTSIQFGSFTVSLGCSVITLPLCFKAKEQVEVTDASTDSIRVKQE